MKNRNYLFLYIISVLLATTSCDMGSSGLQEGSIKSFELPGLIGEVTIDIDNQTVVATVEPMDLSSITPTVTVKEGATLTTAQLVDSEPVVFSVTLDNGTVEEWTVTVTVSGGVVYYRNGTKISLNKGFIHSNDASLNTRYGNDYPAGNYISGINPQTNELVITRESYDWFSRPSDFEFVEINFPNPWVGESSNNFEVYHGIVSGSSFVLYGTDATKSFIIDSYGIVGGFITGSFSGIGTEWGVGPCTFTNGYFKVVRVENDQFDF
jgi:hypothetical protein